jgi:aldehyde:ferredoxin oxidoreductase
MARAFNYREGLTAQDDASHWRLSTPLESGSTEGLQVPADEIAQAIDMYYGMRGWDEETGAPTAGKLRELGISWVAKLLYED